MTKVAVISGGRMTGRMWGMLVAAALRNALVNNSDNIPAIDSGLERVTYNGHPEQLNPKNNYTAQMEDHYHFRSLGKGGKARRKKDRGW